MSTSSTSNNGVAAPLVVLRLPEVMKRTGLGRTSVLTMAKSGEMPAPVALGGRRAVGWFEHEIQTWLANRPRVK